MILLECDACVGLFNIYLFELKIKNLENKEKFYKV